MYRVNRKGEFNVPYGKNANPLICDEVNLRRVSASLKDVQVQHQDYKGVLKYAKKGDFIYLDPPYYPVNKTSSFTAYTNEAFLDKEQIELRNTFAELSQRGCFVMLSNSDVPFINEIYSGINGVRINKVEAGRAINSNGTKRGKVTEVLITNY
jgi:DNA adenine methylase